MFPLNILTRYWPWLKPLGMKPDDMKAKAEEQIPSTYYRQATVFMKRKQYDNAIPYLEKTVESATLYNNNEEIKEKVSELLATASI